jgi:hypothetical protein
MSPKMAEGIPNFSTSVSDQNAWFEYLPIDWWEAIVFSTATSPLNQNETNRYEHQIRAAAMTSGLESAKAFMKTAY